MQEIDPNWIHVEKALNNGTDAGYALAILESEKAIDKIAQEKGVIGKNLETRLKKASRLIISPQELKQARLAKSRIIEQPGIIFSKDEVKQIIRSYWQAYADLQKLPDKNSKITLWQKIPFLFKISAGIIILILGLIVFVNDTVIGQQINKQILLAARITIYWVLPGALAILFLFLAIKKIFKKKKF